MAEPKHLDDISRIPAPVPGGSTLPSPSSTLPGMPDAGNLPPRTHDAGDGRLTRAAQSAGNALGTTVSRVRTRLTVVRGGRGGPSTTEELAGKAKEYSETANRKLQELRDEARQRGDELAQTVEERAAALRTDVKQRIRTLRSQSQRIQNEYPLQLILGAAAVAFVLGFTLRIWRSSRG